VALALTATAGFALLPGTPVSAAATDATISNFSFWPDPVTIPVGATVKWTNDDGVTHTVTADDGSFDSGPKGPHSTFTQTFSQVGTVAYHCAIHTSMHGTVKVGTPTTTTTAAPSTTTTTIAQATTTTTAGVTATTATTAPATATTVPTGTGTTAGGTALPTTAGSAPRSTTSKPAGPSTTRATAASTSTTRPAAATTAANAPAGALTSPTTGPAPLPADTPPPTQVALGVTTAPGGHGGAGRAGLGVAAALLLGVGAVGAVRYRRRSSGLG
jgi:plastocyanin